MDLLKVKRTVLSVSDKSNLVEFAKYLADSGVEIISTGGTGKLLSENNINVIPISQITGNQKDDYFDGRMKTISFNYESSLLFDRDNPKHIEQINELNIPVIDMVVCNLYPFEKTVSDPNVSIDDAIKNIDIGGPCMIRAAAKNYKGVAIITSPDQYEDVINELKQNNGVLSLEFRQALMRKAFELTANYDNAIKAFFASRFGEDTSNVNLEFVNKKQLGRYAENWHQKGWISQTKDASEPSIPHTEQIYGGPLGYNNYLDADAALSSAIEFSDTPCVSIIKHLNPCGFATGNTIEEAFERAWQGDPVSAFGSVIALSNPITKGIVEFLQDKFVEILIAPAIDNDAFDMIKQNSSKKNLRILIYKKQPPKSDALDMKFIRGGLLQQERDSKYYLTNSIDELFSPAKEIECPNSGKKLKVGVVTKNIPKSQRAGLYSFALKHLRFVKSNAIIIAREYADGVFQILGMGCGQPNRKDSVQLASKKAVQNLKLEYRNNNHSSLEEDAYVIEKLTSDNVVLASDAFFPFRDGLDNAASAGVKYIIQPGGSVKDDEVISAANEYEIGMIFTGVRKFNH